MTANPNKRVVVTGAPGTGKSAVIGILGSLGFRVFPEVARELISQGILPFMSSQEPGRADFFTSVLTGRISAHRQAGGAEMTFFDRALPDSLAYFFLRGIEPPDRLHEAIRRYRYHPFVFVAPPWEEIYCRDEVRTEDFTQASFLHELLLHAYAGSGYQTVLLPKGTPAERAEFILTELRSGR